MKKNNYLAILILGLVVITSCKKSIRADEKPEFQKYSEFIIQTEETSNEMEFIGRYIPSNIAQYPDDGLYLGKGLIRRRGTGNGQEITIDFGAGGICTDGKFRSGKLLVEFNETNFDTMVRSQTYRLGEIDVRGNYSIGYVPGSDRLRLNFIALNGKLTKEGQYTLDFTLSRASEFVSGFASPNDITDDVFNRKELIYNLTLNTNGKNSLLKVKGLGESKLQFSCTNRYYPVTGQLMVEMAGTGATTTQNSFKLTFGTGSCNGVPVIN
ncbi:hypothetical protein [Pedobacter sp.]|uniref:hypothetical protein n=1 Tax=Pedobacter sp. TaxID=1411316 RepID=UPI0031E293E3